VTRDRIIADAEWQNHPFTLIDTGGIELKTKDTILHQMRVQAEMAIDMADLILLLTDGREGMTAADAEVAEMIRRCGRRSSSSSTSSTMSIWMNRPTNFTIWGWGIPFPSRPNRDWDWGTSWI